MSLNYTIQKRRDQRADNQQGKSFTELLLGEWKNLSPSNLKEWVAQAQKVDDAEFTALLDEEWEEFSATKKETLAQKARQETARQKEALVQVTQAAEKEVKKAEAALDQRAAMMPRREAEKKLRSAKYGLANVKAFLDAADAKALLDAADVAEAKVVSDAADVEAARLRERLKEAITLRRQLERRRRVSGGSEEARQETARQQAALVKATQAAEVEVKEAEATMDSRATITPMARREAEKRLKLAKCRLADAKALSDVANVAEAKALSDAADVEAARARERVKEVITRVSGGSGAATPTPTPMPTSPTATANGNGNGTKSDNASDKKDWAFNERAEVERVVRKEWRELLAKGHTCKSLDRTRWEQRAKARVAGRCVVSGGLGVSPLTTRNLTL